MRSELEVIGGNFSVVEKIEKELEKEICELAEFQGPKSQVGELNSRIQELLKEIGKQLQSIKNLAEEQDRESEKILLLYRVERHEAYLKEIYPSIRKANAQCNLNINQQLQKEREELLSGGSKAIDTRDKITRESLLQTATGVTEVMKRTSQLLKTEVDRSGQTVNVLANSSSQLVETNKEYKTQKGAIQNTKTILTQLNQRAFTDKLLFSFAFIVYLLVVFYILQKRLFKSQAKEEL